MMRLDKALAHQGAGSRAQVREMIRAGRVQVNGQVCRDPALHVENGSITLDGEPMNGAEQAFIMLYKPAGVLTAADDRKCATVMDLLPARYAACGCMPVGRLDKDTTGLLLLTSDGELAHRLISPKRHVSKVYLAQTAEPLTGEDVAAFEAGVPLKDFTALPAKLEVLGERLGRVTVFEGKYHQVKRMFGARGNRVEALHRVSFGPLALDEGLHPGEYRELTEKEIDALYRSAGRERNP